MRQDAHAFIVAMILSFECVMLADPPIRWRSRERICIPVPDNIGEVLRCVRVGTSSAFVQVCTSLPCPLCNIPVESGPCFADMSRVSSCGHVLRLWRSLAKSSTRLRWLMLRSTKSTSCFTCVTSRSFRRSKHVKQNCCFSAEDRSADAASKFSQGR